MATRPESVAITVADATKTCTAAATSEALADPAEAEGHASQKRGSPGLQLTPGHSASVTTEGEGS